MTVLENTKCNADKAPRTKKGWFIAAGVYYGLLSVLSHIPGRSFQHLPFSVWDKAAHFGVYAMLGFLLSRGFALVFRGRLKPVLLAAVMIGLLGCLDELHQLFVVGRNGDLHDVAADFLGGLFGGIVSLIPMKRLRFTERGTIDTRRAR